MRWAVLLKGLNIGGKRLPMPELKAFLESLGFAEVSTLLASGNAIVSTDRDDGAAIEAMIEAAAAQRLALRTDWLVRNHAELAAVVAADPFPEATADHPSHVTVTFHRERFPADRLAALVHDGPERIVAIGRELHVDYGDAMRESRLPQAMAKARFPKVATARNWNTVTKLAALTA